MNSRVTRRALVKGALMAGVAVPSLGWLRCAEAAPSDLPPLDPKESSAVTLGFINDASKVDTALNPMFARG